MRTRFIDLFRSQFKNTKFRKRIKNIYIMSSSKSSTKKGTLGGDFVTTYKPSNPIPPPPLDPYLLVPPVDFTPFTGYEPSLAEWKCCPPPVEFDGLKQLDLFDVFLAEQQGRKPVSSRGPISKGEMERWRNVLTVPDAPRPEDAPIVADFTILQEFKAILFPSASPAKAEEASGTPVALAEKVVVEEKMEVEEINVEAVDMVHPDKPHLKPVKRQKLRMNHRISAMLGSVYFEDEVPDATRLAGAVLKAANDPSLPSCTAGWLYAPTNEKERKRLFREYEMEQTDREYDLIALEIGEGDVVQMGVIKETFSVRKQRPLEVNEEDEDELLVRIPAEPELAVDHIPTLELLD